MENNFKTKTGFCHVLKDRIVLSKNGIVEDVKPITVGKGVYALVFIDIALSLGLFYFAVDSFLVENWMAVGFFVVMGLVVLRASMKILRYSPTPIIYRDSIEKVIFTQGTSFLTRSRIIIKFLDEKGALKTRLIMLPGAMMKGDKETAKAMAIFKEEGLLN